MRAVASPASRPEHAQDNARAGHLRLRTAEIAWIDEVFPLGSPTQELPTL